MTEALALAERARDEGEVPVGALVVKDGKIIGRGYNLRESKKSATAHAEVLALEEACRTLGSWRLEGCTLYVTLEPCPMCAGALINSRIKRVVYAARDAVAGCVGSVLNVNSYPFNHAFEVSEGVCGERAERLLADFFKEKRKIKKD